THRTSRTRRRTQVRSRLPSRNRSGIPLIATPDAGALALSCRRAGTLFQIVTEPLHRLKRRFGRRRMALMMIEEADGVRLAIKAIHLPRGIDVMPAIGSVKFIAAD